MFRYYDISRLFRCTLPYVLFFIVTNRKYRKKTSRQEWSIDVMNRANQAVLNKEIGNYKVSKELNVPQTTF